MNLKRNWWKLLGVLIILCVIVLGLGVPLNPGITLVEPVNAKAGDTVRMEVTGYNTFFRSSGGLRAWLHLGDDKAVLQRSYEALAETRLVLDFVLPAHLPAERAIAEASLIIDSDRDGSFVRPSALLISALPDNDAALGATAWSATPVRELHDSGAFRFPFRNILAETIRNTYFHVPLWFGMILLFLASAVQSVRYLASGRPGLDMSGTSLVSVGILYGILGLITGAIWAKFTWGAFWSWDVKQNMSAICLLIYAAYFVLRQSVPDQDRRARVSAVYNIFAFIAMIPLLFVIPRMTESLHPGNGGNPALGGDDLDNTMRIIFYPAIIGWTLIGVWMAQLQYRWMRVHTRWLEQ